eukprot:CAMPEP_0196999484 /NCGR_PEP_ID=MMETSP1380-20130617/4650_1 /TAXON_ID=5936 /ORGANISM="Euplotes crassus, Strain CT5" /LENGTH=97 /DNA_ID=CAMNT_0042416425 /DNA_START=198 /DNA_END=495 /DNA_ORIENTATION=+
MKLDKQKLTDDKKMLILNLRTKLGIIEGDKAPQCQEKSADVIERMDNQKLFIYDPDNEYYTEEGHKVDDTEKGQNLISGQKIENEPSALTNSSKKTS